MKRIIKEFILFHTFALLRYLEKYFERYPSIKKNNNEEIAAPAPK